MSACSEWRLPGTDGGDDATWSGKITINSSSVPPPYNWTKSVTLDGGHADFEVGWFPTRSGDNRETRSWQADLTEAQTSAVNSAVEDLSGESSEIMPGNCWITVDLVSSTGQSKAFSVSPPDARFSQIVELFDTLAGAENPTLPSHANGCPH